MWLGLGDSVRTTAIGLALGLPVAFGIAFALDRLTNGLPMVG